MRPVTGFPFCAVVGQESLRHALLLLLVDPRIGGLLVRGHKGTAKSTLVRAAARLLPSGELRTLALGATEDRVVGGIDLEATLACGRPQVQPGVLAEADGGLLYVDEVNLLDDYLADLVLDAAAGGVNVIEREGLSVTRPARFALVGTMNPEEGELRPQLLDRFGMCVDVEAETDPERRAEIMRRRLAYDADPAAFVLAWAGEEAALAARVTAARARCADVRVSRLALERIAALGVAERVAGHRADLVLARAARANAAWEERTSADEDDVDAIADLALTHRRRPPSEDRPQPEQVPPHRQPQPESAPDQPPVEPSPPSQPKPPDGAAPSDDQPARTGPSTTRWVRRSRRNSAPSPATCSALARSPSPLTGGSAPGEGVASGPGRPGGGAMSCARVGRRSLRMWRWTPPFGRRHRINSLAVSGQPPPESRAPGSPC